MGEADTVTHRHATVRYTTDRDLDQLLNRYRYSIYMYGPHTDVSSTISYFLRDCLVKRKKKKTQALGYTSWEQLSICLHLIGPSKEGRGRLICLFEKEL